MWEHPVDSHYRQLVEQERQKRLRNKCTEPSSTNPDDGPIIPPARPSSVSNLVKITKKCYNLNMNSDRYS